MPSSCHGYGLNCLSEFQLPSRGDPASGNLDFASSATLAAVGFPSKRGAGSEQRDVGLCCRKRLGFKQEVILLGGAFLL